MAVEEPERDDENHLLSISATTQHVRRARNGDRSSLEWLVTRFDPFLRAQAEYRLRTSPGLRAVIDADDLVNEVWVVTLPKLGSLRPRSGRFTSVLVRFLGTSLLNVYRANLRRHLASRAGNASALATPLIDGASSTVDIVTQCAQTELHAELMLQLRGMRQLDREILVQRVMEGDRYEAIADRCGLSVGALRTRCHRAIERLRDHFPQSLNDELRELVDFSRAS